MKLYSEYTKLGNITDVIDAVTRDATDEERARQQEDRRRLTERALDAERRAEKAERELHIRLMKDEVKAAETAARRAEFERLLGESLS